MALAGQGRRRVERRLLAAAASPAARARSRFLLRFVATWAALSVLAVIVVGRSAATAVTDYRIDRLDAQVAALTATHRGLVAEVEALRAAPRLSRIAQASGLVLPQTLETLPVSAVTPAPPAEPAWQRVAIVIGRLVRRLP